MSSKLARRFEQLSIPGSQSTQSEAVPPPGVQVQVNDLADVLARLVAYVVTHTTHEGEGDEPYNEVMPKLLRRNS